MKKKEKKKGLVETLSSFHRTSLTSDLRTTLINSALCKGTKYKGKCDAM